LPSVETVTDSPWQMVLAEIVIGETISEYSSVFPFIVMVQGDAAPMQLLLHPAAPQHDLKNCIVKGIF